MHIKSALLMGTACLALVQGRKCGNPGRSSKQHEVARKAAHHEARAAKINGYGNSTNTGSSSSIHIEIYMHSVSATKSGLLRDQDLQKQFDVIADRFEPYDITFELKNTSRTVNRKWANATEELEMKSQLRQGDYKALNLYFTDYVIDNTTSPPDELLGVCYYPTAAPEDSEDFIMDGCTVMSTTIPGGSYEPYDHGITAVHEIGHWFGLAHTFDDGDGQYKNGCSGPGDGVSDTPASASESSGCDIGRNSCPNKPGLDPIHNYMDYSDDTCLTEFSAGQAKRIRSLWNVYRESWPDVVLMA